jgi:hypothetical protein
MRYIYYTSDFELHQQLNTIAPFELTYYIQGKEQRLVAAFDGRKFTNCIPDGDGIIVPVDYAKVQLGIGRLRCTSRYFLNNEHFLDGVCESVSDTEIGIELHRGASDDMGDLVATPLPSYHIVRTEGGGGGYTPPEGGIPREDLAEDVQTSLGRADTALQEGALSDYAKKSEVPTKVSQLLNDRDFATRTEVFDNIGRAVPTKTSQLANDSGYVTESEVATAIANAITNTLNTEV